MLSTFMPSSHLDAFTLDIANADGLALPVFGGAVKPSTLWVSAPSRIVRLQEGLNCIEVNAMGHISNNPSSAFTASSIPLYGITVHGGTITDVQDYRTQDTRLNAADLATKQASVTLTHADLTGPVASIPVIVSASGAGKLIVPLSGVIESHIVTPYTSSASWKLWSGDPLLGVVLTGDLVGPYLTTSQRTVDGPSISSLSPLIILAPNEGSDPLEGGDPTNWLKFTIWYGEYTVAA